MNARLSWGVACRPPPQLATYAFGLQGVDVVGGAQGWCADVHIASFSYCPRRATRLRGRHGLQAG
jgi:hypothetical protein